MSARDTGEVAAGRPRVEHDGAGRAGRGQLHHQRRVVAGDVVVDMKAEPIGVEGLGIDEFAIQKNLRYDSASLLINLVICFPNELVQFSFVKQINLRSFDAGTASHQNTDCWRNMIDPESHSKLKKEISTSIEQNMIILEELRDEIRPIRGSTHRIQPRSTTSISLVGTDGGNNQIQYDPFLIQLVRIVDSSNNEYCLEAVTPTTRVSDLSRAQFDETGLPKTALGRMMQYLGVNDLTSLSHMIRDNEEGQPTSPTWIQVYRELVEWAILFSIIREKHYGSDTLIVFDGLLRSKVFAKDLFRRYLKGVEQGISDQKISHRRRIFLVGLAKHSKVLTRYRLAMRLEGILRTSYPAYIEIPRDIERKAYVWDEYARGSDVEAEDGEVNKFVGGKMFFVKFGSKPTDPIWPVDIFLPQVSEASAIFGYLLADAQNGFPVPLYPMCLQKAHENAALVDFDFVLLQDEILEAIRRLLADEAPALDEEILTDSDPSSARY